MRSDDQLLAHIHDQADRRIHRRRQRRLLAAAAVVALLGAGAVVLGAQERSEQVVTQPGSTTTTSSTTTAATTAPTTTGTTVPETTAVETTTTSTTPPTTTTSPPPTTTAGPTWPPAAVSIPHGGSVWVVYLATSLDRDDPLLAEAVATATAAGYDVRADLLDCAVGAEAVLGIPEEPFGTQRFVVTIYFATEPDARLFVDLYPHDVAGVGVVDLYCGD